MLTTAIVLSKVSRTRGLKGLLTIESLKNAFSIFEKLIVTLPKTA